MPRRKEAMWMRKSKPSIIFCHLIVYLRFLLSHVFVHSVRHFSLGECLCFAIGCIMLLVGCIMLLCSFWSAIWTLAQFNFPAVASHAELLPTHASVPGNTQNKHLTKGHTSQTFDKLIDAVQFFFVFHYSSLPAAHSSHASLFFNSSYCANSIPLLEWWMPMWLFLSHSFFVHIHKIYFHSTTCARNNQNFSRLTHFSLFVHVHSSQQSWQIDFFFSNSAKCELRW